MLLNPYRFPPQSSAKWDASRTSGGVVVYSEGDLRVDQNGSTTRCNCRSVSQIGTSKVYFEIFFGGNSSSAQEPAFGLASGALSETANPGLTNSWALRKDGSKIGQGANVSGYTRALVPGDIIGVAANPATGSMWFSLNGTWIGDPAAGTGQAFTNITSTLFAFASMRDSLTPMMPWVKARFSPSDWTYTAPPGFGAIPV